jgi:hypothetical protein
MNKKEGNFFEKHVEKIVMGVVGLVCLWLLITRVLLGPVYVEYDNEKFNPRAIDNYISEQAAALESKLNHPPQPKEPYQPRVGDFDALLASAISDIDTSFSLPQPVTSLSSINDNRVYRIPLIGEVNEVAAGHIRAVAYVPDEDVSEENVYSIDNSEPNDIDFVTVEAKFDVLGLYKRFNESFAGENIPQDWRDPFLATPVFAAVQLQRQKLLSDGTWSNWQTVPRSKIDSRKRMFEIIEDIDDLPAGGLKVRLLQFDDAVVRMDMLQPRAYQIVSAKEQWFPPSLHEKYLEYQKAMEAVGRREAAAGRRVEREEERAERRSRQAASRTRQASEGTAGAGGLGALGTEGERPVESAPAVRRPPSRRGQTERDAERERPQRSSEVSKTIDDVYKEFDAISIVDKTDLTKIDKPLLFWAYDDTAEPGNSYRYRIRLGVFNPIAGTSQLSEQDKSSKDKVILWSNFSDVTKTVDIPARLYFFPRGVQETIEAVTVQVSKYVLGYWYSKDFTVKRGELIGKAEEYKMTEEEEKGKITVPKTVDYTTGAVLVDVVPVNDWGNNLRARRFSDMLYSFDGKDIRHLPVETRYWDESLQSRFNEIKKAEKEPKEPLRVWESRATPTQRRSTPLPTTIEEEEPSTESAGGI